MMGVIEASQTCSEKSTGFEQSKNYNYPWTIQYGSQKYFKR